MSMTYQIVKKFPRDEDLGLKIQMKKAAVLVTSTVAEGFSRARHTGKKRWYNIAKGSLTELQSQSLVACDGRYRNTTEYGAYAKQPLVVLPLLIGLIRSSKDKDKQ